jgi:hypothetical protein
MSEGELLVVTIGLFGLAIGFVGWFLSSDMREEHRLREVHATRSMAHDPWDADRR